MSSSDEPYSVGEKPGKGVYACKECGSHVTLRDNADPLPSCKICEDDAEVDYIRIS